MTEIYSKEEGCLLTPRTYRENKAAVKAAQYYSDPDVAIVKTRYRYFCGPVGDNLGQSGLRGILEKALAIGLVKARTIWISSEDDGLEWTLPSGQIYLTGY